MVNLALPRIHLQTIMGIDVEGSDIDDLEVVILMIYLPLLLHLFKCKSQLLESD